MDPLHGFVPREWSGPYSVSRMFPKGLYKLITKQRWHETRLKVYYNLEHNVPVDNPPTFDAKVRDIFVKKQAPQ